MFHAPLAGEGHGPSPIRLRALSLGAGVQACRRAGVRGIRGIRGEVYLHRSAVPLDEAVLPTPADRGQLDLWANECEGMCGV